MGKEKDMTKEEALAYRPGVQHSVDMHPRGRNSPSASTRTSGGGSSHHYRSHANDSDKQKKDEDDGRFRVAMHPSRTGGPPVVANPMHPTATPVVVGRYEDDGDKKKKEDDGNRVKVALMPSRATNSDTSSMNRSPAQPSPPSTSERTRHRGGREGGDDKDEKKERSSSRPNVDFRPSFTSSSTERSGHSISQSRYGPSTSSSMERSGVSPPSSGQRPYTSSSTQGSGLPLPSNDHSAFTSSSLTSPPTSSSTERSGLSLPSPRHTRHHGVAADPSPSAMPSQPSRSFHGEDSEKEKMRLKAEEEGVPTREFRSSVGMSASRASSSASRASPSLSKSSPSASSLDRRGVPSGPGPSLGTTTPKSVLDTSARSVRDVTPRDFLDTAPRQTAPRNPSQLEPLRSSSTATDKAREAVGATETTPTPRTTRSVSGTPLRAEDIYGPTKATPTAPTTSSARDEKRAVSSAPLRPLRNIEHMYPGGRQEPACRAGSIGGVVSVGSDATPATTDLHSVVSSSSTDSRPLHSSLMEEDEEDHAASLNRGNSLAPAMRRGPRSVAANKLRKEASNEELMVVQPINVVVVPESEPLRPRVIDLDANIDKSTYKGMSEHEKEVLAKESGVVFKDGEVFIDEEVQVKKRRRRRRITVCVVLGLILFGIIGGAVGYSFTSRTDDGLSQQLLNFVDTLAPSVEPSMAPSEAPSGAPTSLHERCVVETLAAQSYITKAMVARMKDPSTPQNRAIGWLANEDPAGNDCTDEENLRYRYLFALLYFATGGDHWTYKANFLSEKNVCGWWEYRKKKKQENPLGLWCLKNETDGFDVYLNLKNNNLTGTIPEELIILEEAHTISLGKNMLTGTIPNIIGDFPAIVEFLVEENDLTGTIPEEWGKSGNLTVLNVTDNYLNGTIPSSLANIPSLTWIYASHNSFSGAVPSFFRNKSMRRLLLSNNALTGNLADVIDTLPRQLEYLWLGSNLVTGTIPTFFGDEFHNMMSLDLRANPGLFGTIPPSLNKWSKLWQLTLNECNFSGEIPFTPHAFPETNLIQLFDNRLSGTLPEAFFTYEELTVLHLSKNDLIGTIPTLVGNLTKLRELALGWNELTGSIPTELGQLWQLQRFGCSHNEISGTLPTELGLLFNAEILSLRNNSLTGTIPSQIGDLKYVTEFLADQNELMGTLPQTFVGMKNLGYLDLSQNGLLGNISFLCVNEIPILGADCKDEAEGEHVEVVCSCCSICCDRDGGCFSAEQEGGA